MKINHAELFKDEHKAWAGPAGVRDLLNRLKLDIPADEWILNESEKLAPRPRTFGPLGEESNGS